MGTSLSTESESCGENFPNTSVWHGVCFVWFIERLLYLEHVTLIVDG